MVDIKKCYFFYFNKKIKFAKYSLSIDHLEYSIMFVCNRKVTLSGVYSKLTNSIGSWAPPPPPPPTGLLHRMSTVFAKGQR